MNQAVDLSWLVGKWVVDVEHNDHSWFFRFSDGGVVSTESDWRLVTSEGIRVTGPDEGQLFGLGQPMDARARVLELTQGKRLLGFRIAGRTGDLSLEFDDRGVLEFVNLSSGYESWRAQFGSNEIICLGGGQVVRHPANS
jgi:hypothetical protein